MSVFYFDDMGSWSASAPEGVDFSAYGDDDHYTDFFEAVSDWLMAEWARYLASSPHSADLDPSGECRRCANLLFKFKSDN